MQSEFSHQPCVCLCSAPVLFQIKFSICSRPSVRHVIEFAVKKKSNNKRAPQYIIQFSMAQTHSRSAKQWQNGLNRNRFENTYLFVIVEQNANRSKKNEKKKMWHGKPLALNIIL